MPRGLVGPGLVAWVAEILQEDLAETEVAWGQSRPPCPCHLHPARPVVRATGTAARFVQFSVGDKGTVLGAARGRMSVTGG